MMLESVARSLKLIRDHDSKYYIPYSFGGYSKYVNVKDVKTHSLLPNCTGGAFGLALQFMETTDFNKVSLPRANAGDWYRLAGWKKSKYPVVGSIACWSNKSAGHVAVVINVKRNSNGDAVKNGVRTLESSAFSYKGKDWREGYTYKYNANTGTLAKSGYTFQGYLLCPNVEPDPVGFQVGDKVKIIGKGNSRKDGKGKTSYGLGYIRQVLKVFPDAKYPYQIGNSKGTITGYYKAEALEKI